MKVDLYIKVTRDVGFLLFGFGGILHQQWSGHVSPYLLVVYSSMLGLPSIAGLIALKRNTYDSSSPSPPPSESEESSIPSSRQLGGSDEPAE